MSNEREKFRGPKEIALVLETEYGLTLSRGYIAAVKRHTIRHRERLFIVGMARPSEVLEWLRNHPEFRRDHNGASGFDLGGPSSTSGLPADE